ncbi:ABC-type branched-chain amino acid transport systems, ATPase component [Sphaerochaeta pleomorpha str. Grapes]|uniref:ABC-type branched-chain amino acid transport systems, ATPase component n=1 Tax=Sphaerochaeta pleomorpha (strain ATCC BAA-1885 / DSM 22778 / Grapes) TaxID=158190 RepID=G8QUE9_SPHPG|nr:ABC transporter ATP-binding protein [Sphaerochaeta pleomorpha]AEV29182.1 ABC-type branched-chain amino acid transport systems, ATPase component [Sphaerochaeta pleomorpha str. Grapes]
MSDILLKTDHLTMQFGGVVAVDDLNIEIPTGKIVALIGPNGAGKTTAFNVITGVYSPTNGAVSFDKRIIGENHPRSKMKKLYNGTYKTFFEKQVINTPDKITYLGMARTFQNIRLFKELTVFENVLIAKHCHIKAGMLRSTFKLNKTEERTMHEESEKLLETVGLIEHRNEKASSLPYGKQRRLEIARALATGPKLLLLDEPAAGMNPKETEELALFIQEIKQSFDLTIFLIEHHMNLVMDISDKIYVLDYGKTIAVGNPKEIQNDPAVIRAYLGVEEV